MNTVPAPLPANTLEFVQWTTVQQNNGFANPVGTGAIPVPVTGEYAVSAWVDFTQATPTNTPGTLRFARISAGPILILGQSGVGAVQGANTTVSTSGLVSLSAGDNITLMIQQNDTGNTTIVAARLEIALVQIP